MCVFEVIGELCTIYSCLLKGWRYVFSTSYRNEAHRHWRAEGFFRSAPGICYALLLMIAEVLLLFYVIRVATAGSRAE